MVPSNETGDGKTDEVCITQNRQGHDELTEAVTEQPHQTNEQSLHHPQLAYFSTKSTPEVKDSRTQTVRKQINDTISSLAKQIEFGQVVIRSEPVEQQSHAKTDRLEGSRRKRQELEKQMGMINQQLQEHRQIEQKQRTERQLQKKERLKVELKHREEIDRKMNQWKEEKKIQEMRKILFQKKQRERKERESALEEERKEEIARKTSQQRKKHFEEYMKSLERRKQQRLKQIAQKVPTLSKSESRTVSQKEEQMTVPERPKVNFEEIKLHEKIYMQKVQERSPKFSSNPIVEHPEQFHLLDRRDSQIIREKAKAKRRADFDSKIAKNIRISVDSEMKHRTELAIDKEKNRMKYLILGRKGLSDEEIFNYKEQSFKTGDSKKIREVGNAYLNEVKGVVRKVKSEKSVSVKSDPQMPLVAVKSPPRYTNYLETGKRPRLTEMQRLMQEARVQPAVLIQKSDEYESQVLKEIREFSKKKDAKSYKESIETESKIDDLYLKSLKARLACAAILK